MSQLLFGLARRLDAHLLHSLLREFLKLIDILPVDGALMKTHALSRNLTLVTPLNRSMPS
jgi:hypothetical protein